MANLAIIPARGGSKRIPRKNIKPFLGKPIIAYSIEAAIQSNLFDEVMVSTDDIEIAEIAKKYGATVPFLRSSDNANDFAVLADVIEEVLEQYKKNKNLKFDTICCIMATNPFVNPYVIKDSCEKLIKSKGESLIAVTKCNPPIQRTFEIKDGILSFVYPEHFYTRTQDLSAHYFDAGSFFWVKVDAFKIHKKGITNKTIPYILQDEFVQDIDTMSDWKLAELKYRLMTDE